MNPKPNAKKYLIQISKLNICICFSVTSQIQWSRLLWSLLVQSSSSNLNELWLKFALDFSILLHDTPLIESLTRFSIHNIPSHHLHESFGKCPIFAALSHVAVSEVFRMSSPSKGCVSPRLLGNLLQTQFSSKLNRYRNCP